MNAAATARYKIKASDRRQLHAARDAVAEAGARIPGMSEKRLFLSTDDLSAELQERIRATGARVVREMRYDLESPR